MKTPHSKQTQYRFNKHFALCAHVTIHHQQQRSHRLPMHNLFDINIKFGQRIIKRHRNIQTNSNAFDRPKKRKSTPCKIPICIRIV